MKEKNKTTRTTEKPNQLTTAMNNKRKLAEDFLRNLNTNVKNKLSSK